MKTIQIAAALLFLASCGRESSPPPAPPPTAAAPESGGLKPLTSRDGAPSPGEAMGGAAAETLPPGHPPIDGSAGMGAPGEALRGSVVLSPSLASRKGAALFLIARNARSQQIVAVRKEDAARFPVSFSISGADAMTEGTSFEGPLDLLARLSQTGDAIPAKGDIEGVAKGLKPGATDVRIVLDSVRQ